MSDRKIFHDSVTELPEEHGATPAGLKINASRPEHINELMPVSFSLAIPKQAHDDLESLVESGKTVSPKELESKYGVGASQVEPLVKWLKTQGFEVTRVSDDGTSVFARASAAQIEKSLQVKMVRVTKDGITYTAARNAPSLPAEIASSVHAIGGLQPFRHFHRHHRWVAPKNRQIALANAAPSPNVANTPPFLVSEILKAYNADGLGLTGNGQVIAILIDTFPLDSDLQGFWKANLLQVSLSQIQKINVSGGALPPTEGEETLDAEWTSGVAPGATIRIYASGSLSFADIDKALDQIISDAKTIPGLRQVSISLGLGETFMQPAEVRTQHQKYLRLAALGVNVFISTGDAGSNPDSTGHGSGGPLQAESSASDTAVVGVGGTSLVLKGDGTVMEETGWSDGGGGKSMFFKRPAWQKGQGVPSGTKRVVPDVSAVADPNTGAIIFVNGQVDQIGGTSWSAPIWAGLCALLNEARVKAGKSMLPFLNPILYPLLNTPSFRDVTTGNNGAYDAGSGYDLVTGLGVPNVKELIKALTK